MLLAEVSNLHHHYNSQLIIPFLSAPTTFKAAVNGGYSTINPPGWDVRVPCDHYYEVQSMGKANLDV
jgi:hypothetical protein